jgi:hypothetical protein
LSDSRRVFRRLKIKAHMKRESLRAQLCVAPIASGAASGGFVQPVRKWNSSLISDVSGLCSDRVAI